MAAFVPCFRLRRTSLSCNFYKTSAGKGVDISWSCSTGLSFLSPKDFLSMSCIDFSAGSRAMHPIGTPILLLSGVAAVACQLCHGSNLQFRPFNETMYTSINMLRDKANMFNYFIALF